MIHWHMRITPFAQRTLKKLRHCANRGLRTAARISSAWLGWQPSAGRDPFIFCVADPKHPCPAPASLCALVRTSTWVREDLEHLFMWKHREKKVAYKSWGTWQLCSLSGVTSQGSASGQSCSAGDFVLSLLRDRDDANACFVWNLGPFFPSQYLSNLFKYCGLQGGGRVKGKKR